jgi:hypothetical protein
MTAMLDPLSEHAEEWARKQLLDLTDVSHEEYEAMRVELINKAMRRWQARGRQCQQGRA